MPTSYDALAQPPAGTPLSGRGRQAMDGICNWENFRVYDFPPPTMKQACETVPRPSRVAMPNSPALPLRAGGSEQPAAGSDAGMRFS